MRLCWLIALLLFLSWGCVSASPTLESSTSDAALNEPIQPVPLPLPRDAKQQSIIALGERLFSDPRLSSTNTTACINCHTLSKGGADGERFSRQPSGELAPVNTPTIFNLPLNFRLFWDGRKRTLDEQIRTDPFADSDTHWDQALGKLKADTQYPADFATLFPDGLTITNIQNAIVAFEKSLVLVNSRFDRYLRGDLKAITDAEAKGYSLFKTYGCTACHQGANVGGNLFQKFGIMGDYFKDNGHSNHADAGRYNTTKLEDDRYVFRVPSLRLATLTAPYFHDGSAKTLEDAIKVMAKYQLGRPISDEHISLIIGFLKTLPGEYQGQPLGTDSTP